MKTKYERQGRARIEVERKKVMRKEKMLRPSKGVTASKWVSQKQRKRNERGKRAITEEDEKME